MTSMPNTTPMPTVTVRPMTVDEAPVTAALFREVVGSLAIYTEEARAHALAQKTEAALIERVRDDPYSMLLAWDGDKAVGFMTSRKDDGTLWLSWLGVLPEYRRHGVGEVLLRAAESTAVHRGMKKAWCDCRTDNHASRALLTKLGYRIIGEVTQHWHGQDYYLWDKHL